MLILAILEVQITFQFHDSTNDFIYLVLMNSSWNDYYLDVEFKALISVIINFLPARLSMSLFDILYCYADFGRGLSQLMMCSDICMCI